MAHARPGPNAISMSRRGRRRGRARAVLEVGCGPRRDRGVDRARDRARGRRARPVGAHGRADARARHRRARRRRSGASVRGRVVRLRRRGVDALPRRPTSIAALSELARVLRPGGRLVAATNSKRQHAGAQGRWSVATVREEHVQRRERRGEPLRRHFARCRAARRRSASDLRAATRRCALPRNSIGHALWRDTSAAGVRRADSRHEGP